ncbi:hypothetical protein IFO69_19955 [Echinicola sp. CAU 1574]|uniref:Uncharacterized protein n=1 Tax=Echinicola arenosa TaxID=2774144 RepID=A0ABR9AQH3_9BACT|nr:hypothetical protein [Echinicola arenosa]MBD8491038.1 hypothetical protein [Echinicola arenosa]
MEKILRFYRENLVFIFLMIIIIILFLIDIRVIDTYVGYHYPPIELESPNIPLAILVFIRNLSGLLMLRYLYKKRENIMNLFYNFYNAYDDPISNDIPALIEEGRINKEAGIYIMEKNLSLLSGSWYYPAVLHERKKDVEEKFPEIIEVKNSKLGYSILGFIFLIYLLLQLMNFIESINILSMSNILRLSPVFIFAGFAIYFFRKALSKKVIMKISQLGILIDAKLYRWSNIKYVYFEIYGGKKRCLTLHIMPLDCDNPIEIHHDLHYKNYNRKQLGHILETYHRRYS